MSDVFDLLRMDLFYSFPLLVRLGRQQCNACDMSKPDRSGDGRDKMMALQIHLFSSHAKLSASQIPTASLSTLISSPTLLAISPPRLVDRVLPLRHLTIRPFNHPNQTASNQTPRP